MYGHPFGAVILILRAHALRGDLCVHSSLPSWESKLSVETEASVEISLLLSSLPLQCLSSIRNLLSIHRSSL